MKHRNSVRALLASYLFMLAACGGGGGNSSPSTPPPPADPDGLGAAGRISEAVAVSNNLPVYGPVVSFDDSERGLVVWSDSNANGANSSPTTYFWTSSDSQGTWRMPAVVEGLLTRWNVPVLRKNAAGDAVVDSGGSQWGRYSPSGGWQLIDGSKLFGSASDGLLADGTLPTAMAATPSQSPQSFRKAASVRLQKADDPHVTTYESPPMDEVLDLSVASIPTSAPQGELSMSYVARSDWAPSNHFSVEQLRLPANGLSAADPTPLLFVPASTYCLGWRVRSSGSGATVLAMFTKRDGERNCNFSVARISAPGAEPISRQLNSQDGYGVESLSTLHTPIMDSNGNALVMWRELRGEDGATARLMWSQSVANGQWSDPTLLVSESQSLGKGYVAKISMNAQGQAAALATTFDKGTVYLVRSRFTFAAGWSAWTRIAEGLAEMSEFDVAINSQGKELAVFRMTPCANRAFLPGGGMSRSGCGTPTIYAVRF